MRQTRTSTTTRVSPSGDAVRGGTVVVTTAELDGEAVELLPRRDTLCRFGCVDVTTVVGINLAFAVNAATANSTANAIAAQYLVAIR
jgi:hypothetical protein